MPTETPPASRQFRAATLEAAVARAREELGGEVRPVTAARLRSGGVLGFFARDLGVEVTVTRDDSEDEPPPPEPPAPAKAAPATVDDMFGRLVDDVSADERRTPVRVVADAEPEPAPPARDPVFAQLLARALDRPAVAAGAESRAPTAAAASTTVDEIVARITAEVSQALSAATGAGPVAGPVVVVPVVITVNADGTVRNGPHVAR